MSELNMQHANLSRIATGAEPGDPLICEARRASVGSRSARTQLALRELASLQAQVARLAAMIEAAGEDDDPQPAPGQHLTDAAIRAILQARLERHSHFPGDLFADPAWDMLLDLYAAELSQIRVSVSSVCIASNAPASTALRWISTLEREGLIERRQDPLDGRRFFLSLTRDAVERFERYFAAVGKPPVI